MEQNVCNLEVGKLQLSLQDRVIVRLKEVMQESSRQGESKSRFEHSKTYRIWETYIQEQEHSSIAIVGNNGSLGISVATAWTTSQLGAIVELSGFAPWSPQFLSCALTAPMALTMC